MTGDIISSSQLAATTAKKQLDTELKDAKKRESLNIPPYLMHRISSHFEGDSANTGEVADVIFGVGATIPDPVFYCSIEPPSLAFQTPLDVALAQLLREDSSLRLTNNIETGQMVLAGKFNR